jgi:hypothetical protein
MHSTEHRASWKRQQDGQEVEDKNKRNFYVSAITRVYIGKARPGRANRLTNKS